MGKLNALEFSEETLQVLRRPPEINPDELTIEA
jgi:hypothetical protein